MTRNNNWFAACLGAVVFVSLAACGGGSDGGSGGGGAGGADTAVAQDVSGGGETSAGGQDATTNDTAAPANIVQDPFQIDSDVVGTKITVKGRILRPASCQPAQPCPGIVIVPDRDVTPVPDYVASASLLAKEGYVVLVYNPPGRGSGSDKSTGVSDFGGKFEQAAAYAVMKSFLARKDIQKVNDTQMAAGYLTIGFGLVPTAKIISLWGTATLAKLLFVVDVEGPTDRCAITAAPPDPAKGIKSDGAGATDSTCWFSSAASGDGTATHSEKYPAGSGGLPDAIVCSENAWPISDGGEDCTSNTWWTEREPRVHMKAWSVRYQRLQFINDHRLPSPWAGRDAYKAIANSKSKFFVFNDMPPCTALPTHEECLTQGANFCYLGFDAVGDGLKPAPFAASLNEVTLDELFGAILPQYVARMFDVKNQPKCAGF